MWGLLLHYKANDNTGTTSYYLYIQVDSWTYVVFIIAK